MYITASAQLPPLECLVLKEENSRSWTVTFFIMGKTISASSWNRSSCVACSSPAAQRSATILYFRFSFRHSFRTAWTISSTVGWPGTDFCSSELKHKAHRNYQTHINPSPNNSLPTERKQFQAQGSLPTVITEATLQHSYSIVCSVFLSCLSSYAFNVLSSSHFYVFFSFPSVFSFFLAIPSSQHPLTCPFTIYLCRSLRSITCPSQLSSATRILTGEWRPHADG